MVARLKTYLTQGNTFYGLEAYPWGETVRFCLLEVILVKGALTITQNRVFDALHRLPNFAKTSIPIHLVYNTAEVITKLLEPASTLKESAAVAHKFPGLHIDHFYVQIAPLKSHKAISVVKKKVVDDLLASVQKMGFKVVGVSLGITSLHAILNYIDEKTIYTNTQKIVWDNAPSPSLSIVKTDETRAKTYTANGLQIDRTALLPFSGIVSFVAGSTKGYSNFAPLTVTLKNTYESNRIFTLLLRFSLALVLVVLLVNFISFSYYFDKTTSLRKSAGFDTAHKKRLTLVRDRIHEKEKKIEALWSSSNSRATLYLDRLAVTVPKSILLTELLYQPLQKPVQASQPIALQENKILLLGICASSTDFSSWITHLETFDWITSVETMDYDYKNNRSSTFKLQIRATTP